MATGSYDIASDQLVDIKCCVCAENNRTTEADKYCVECSDYYCLSCVDTHRTIPVLKGHKLLDKADFRYRRTAGSLPSAPTQRCSIHPRKVVDMFCADHDEVACASCIALNHRNCKKVHSIPEEIDSLQKHSDLKAAKDKIKGMQNVMQEIKTSIQTRAPELKKSETDATKSVQSFKQELQTLLDNMEERSLAEVKKKYGELSAQFEQNVENVNTITEVLDDISDTLQKSAGNKAQEFVCIKSLQKIAATVEKERHVHKIPLKETVIFASNQKLKTCLQQTEELGCVRSIAFRFKNGLYKVKQKKEVEVRLSSDTRECRVVDSCITGSSSVLLADFENKKLKLLNIPTDTVTDKITLEAEPHGVCMVSKTEAAVTSGSKKSVQFVSLAGKLTATHKFSVEYDCRHIVHHDGKLFINDEVKTLYIHDMTGQKLQSVSTDAAGNQIFSAVRRMTVSPDGDKVIVADSGKGLIILDSEGKYLTTHGEYKQLCIQGVCTDGRNMFVCGWDSNNIVQLGQDFKMLGELGKVDEPFSICFDPLSCQLFVTRDNSDTISIIELE